MRSLETKTQHHPSTTLYKVVFESAQVKMSVVLLFAFLLLQPVSLAFASELPEEIPGEPAETIVIDTQEPEETPEEPVAAEVIEPAPADSAVDDEANSTSEPSSETTVEETAAEIDEELLVPVAEPVSTSTPLVDEAESATSTDETVENDSATSTSETEEPEVINDDENLNEEPQPEEEIIDEEPDLNEATTTQDSASTTEESVLVVDHNSSAYEFDTKECANVGDGAFYCSSTQDTEEFLQDGVFAAPDAGGDLEIFVRLNGEESIITSNSVDDSAPYYDALSERIVWHANYNDRYQIISHDLKTGDEKKLTSATYNNMEPVAYGDITLWQAWINNNWEIIMYNGNEQIQLTQNDVHDVSPHMRGGYVVWQTQFAEGWQVAVYDQETKHIEYVEAEGGAKIENPRFVLVYDSTNKAGDIQTVGYDFDNKQSFTLNSIPADLPDELPEPDQTGETRALIQNKHSVKGTEIEETDVVPTTGSSTATSTDSLPTLDLTSASTSAASSTTSTVVPDVTEIVIPPYETVEENQEVSHIADILIPPLQATSSAEVR